MFLTKNVSIRKENSVKLYKPITNPSGVCTSSLNTSMSPASTHTYLSQLQKTLQYQYIIPQYPKPPHIPPQPQFRNVLQYSTPYLNTSHANTCLSASYLIPPALIHHTSKPQSQQIIPQYLRPQHINQYPQHQYIIPQCSQDQYMIP